MSSRDQADLSVSIDLSKSTASMSVLESFHSTIVLIQPSVDTVQSPCRQLNHFVHIEMGQSPEHYSPPAYLLVCISTKWEPVIIPRDAVIAESKLTDYLLDPRLYDDKSKYLLQGGFTKENPERLNAAIRD